MREFMALLGQIVFRSLAFGDVRERAADLSRSSVIVAMRAGAAAKPANLPIRPDNAEIMDRQPAGSHRSLHGFDRSLTIFGMNPAHHGVARDDFVRRKSKYFAAAPREPEAFGFIIKVPHGKIRRRGGDLHALLAFTHGLFGVTCFIDRST